MSWRSLAAVGVFVLAWELAGRLNWLNPVILSHPSAIAHEARRLWESGELASDTIFTLQVFAQSFAIAWILGVTVGFFVGLSSLADELFSPFLIVANSLPKIVLMPIIVLWLGIGNATNIFLGSLMASFPILMSVRAGIKSIDPALLDLGRVYRASPVYMFQRIVLPAITPFLLSGMRVAVGYGMVGVLIAEFFGGNRGLGFRMVLYTSNFEIAAFFVDVVVVAVISLVLTWLVHTVEKRVETWRPSAFPPGM